MVSFKLHGASSRHIKKEDTPKQMHPLHYLFNLCCMTDKKINGIPDSEAYRD